MAPRRSNRFFLAFFLTGTLLIIVVLGAYGVKTLVRPFFLPEESQAIMRLAAMFDESEAPLLTFEWTKTDPAKPAPNSLTYDWDAPLRRASRRRNSSAPNSLTYDWDALSLTPKTPSETVVYGPVKPEILTQLAARIRGGEELKVSEVTKYGAAVVSR